MRKEIIEFNKSQRGSKKMDFQAGDVVKVHLKIKEGGKERIQIFEGLVIAVKGRQSSSPTITVRKVSHGVGVEMIVPVLSPNVSKIELVKKAKVRRAKLYYVRELTTKQSRMKYKDIAAFIKEESPKVEASEEVKEEKLEEAEEKAETEKK
jgi:large subunit ribosomal protein L19